MTNEIQLRPSSPNLKRSDSEDITFDRQTPRTVGKYIFVSVSIIIISLILLIIFSKLSTEDSQLSSRLYLAAVNISVLSVLFTLYFLVSNLYKETFYFLIGINWLIIAIELIFQVAMPLKDRTEIFYFTLSSMSMVSNIIAYIASRLPKNSQINFSEIGKGLLIWFFQIMLTYIIGIFFKPDIDKGLVFLIAQTPLSVWTLVSIGNRIKERLASSNPRNAAFLLSLSFYLFGLLQLPFLAIFIIKEISSLDISYVNYSHIILSIASLLIFALNIGCLFIILSFKYEEQFVQRSVLEELGAFSTTLEHDTRTPLAIINADLAEMNQTYKDDDLILTNIKSLKEQFKRIDEAINFIVILRSDADSAQSLLEKTKIEDVINSAKEKIKQDMAPGNISFSVRSSGEICGKLHKPSFEKVIRQILKNSVEAILRAERSEGKIEIEINRNSQNPPMIMIKIVDNGSGIHPKVIPNLTLFGFSTKQHPNSGNGLFITEKIIKIHRGELEIESKEGEETTVTLLLPALDS